MPAVSDKATVLFSGGSDSTLCAALNLIEHGQVNLVTYRRSKLTGLTRYEKCRYYIPALNAKYKAENIFHIYDDYTDLFLNTFKNDLEHDLTTYGSHLFILVCMACKLAMHTQTILFNLRHGIRFAADGSFHGQDHSPEQMPLILKEIKGLYARFGIDFSYPIYHYADKNAIQKHLYELGIAKSPVFQRKALSTSDAYLYHKNQPSCYLGTVAGVYSKFYYGPLFGSKRRGEDSMAYYREKLSIAEEHIRHTIAAEGLKPLG